MKGFLVVLALGFFVATWAEEPKILEDVKFEYVVEEEPEGDLKIKKIVDGYGPDHGERPPGTGAKSLGGNYYGNNRYNRGGYYYAQCPAYGYKPVHPICSAANECYKSHCKVSISKGYYCGLQFFLHKPLVVAGTYCKSKTQQCGKNHWRKCYCTTKFCWFKLKKVIKHYSKFYIVYVWMRRACGCECRGKMVPKPYYPPVHYSKPSHPKPVYPKPHYPTKPVYHSRTSYTDDSYAGYPTGGDTYPNTYGDW
ncbi:uncharacterized protein LOC120334530 [Styela clava]